MPHPPSYTPEQAAEVLELHRTGQSVRVVARRVGLSRQATHRIIMAATRPPPRRPAAEPVDEPEPPAAAAAGEGTGQPSSAAPAPQALAEPVVVIGPHRPLVDFEGRVECPRCLRRVTVAVAARHLLGTPAGTTLPLDDDEPSYRRREPFPW
jgi:Helix-turn-helix domain of resolvase